MSSAIGNGGVSERVEHAQLARAHLDLPGRQLGVLRARGARGDDPAHRDHVFVPQLRGDERRRLRLLRIADHLGDPRAVPQVDEDQPAEVAPVVHPAHQRHVGSDVARPEAAVVVRAPPRAQFGTHAVLLSRSNPRRHRRRDPLHHVRVRVPQRRRVRRRQPEVVFLPRGHLAQRQPVALEDQDEPRAHPVRLPHLGVEAASHHVRVHAQAGPPEPVGERVRGRVQAAGPRRVRGSARSR